MQHIITDEEIKRFMDVFRGHPGSYHESQRAALADFLNNRPESTLGKLRPIAEMPETVPEGCLRVYANKIDAWYASNEADDLPFACDIQLPTPDPEAEERQRFEEAMKKALVLQEGAFERDSLGNYVKEYMIVGWNAWKLAKAK